ncbi:hypothetical protein SCLCIDRAFT_600806 [Scleroderma citrinum Foug A]|uniref:Uncharacterized protein n=1 Tax=Scleroderma citrinum Foug A TaxID=1036808 RepID=A0A0C3E961_9AGAM|nr:hypothetical protein SCLCIDRAFT_600806 [Scleroderma citrinum Foug A]
MITLEVFTCKPLFDSIESVADIKSRLPGRPSGKETFDCLTDGWWNVPPMSAVLGTQTIVATRNGSHHQRDRTVSGTPFDSFMHLCSGLRMHLPRAHQSRLKMQSRNLQQRM